MKSSLLPCSFLLILTLSACSSPSASRSTPPRYAKIQTTPPSTEATARPTPVATTANPPVAPIPVAISEPVQEPVTPAVEVTPAPPIAPAPVTIEEPAPVAPGIQTRRNGAIVHLNWILPESPSGYRAIEIMRNSVMNPMGRERVRAVRAEVTSLDDTVPNASATYWYWLKITHVDGTIQNLGPFAANAKG